MKPAKMLLRCYCYLANQIHYSKELHMAICAQCLSTTLIREIRVGEPRWA